MRKAKLTFQDARRAARNPFLIDAPDWGGDAYQEWVDATSRIERVRSFNAEECRWAIALRGVQTTVRQAAET